MRQIDSGLELLKAKAFQLYLKQYPNPNITAIAADVEKDRSRVSRWAKDGQWLEMAKRIRLNASKADTSEDAPVEGLVVDLQGAKSFDEVLDRMAEQATVFLASDFTFGSANEILRFLELVEKHKDRKAKDREVDETDSIVDSCLPEREELAFRAGMLLINAHAQGKVISGE